MEFSSLSNLSPLDPLMILQEEEHWNTSCNLVDQPFPPVENLLPQVCFLFLFYSFMMNALVSVLELFEPVVPGSELGVIVGIMEFIMLLLVLEH